jgi:hypothetical protein
VGADKLALRAILLCFAASFQRLTMEQPFAAHCALLQNTTGSLNLQLSCRLSTELRKMPGGSLA